MNIDTIPVGVYSLGKESFLNNNPPLATLSHSLVLTADRARELGSSPQKLAQLTSGVVAWFVRLKLDGNNELWVKRMEIEVED